MNVDAILDSLDTLTLPELRRVVAAGQELIERIETWQQPALHEPTTSQKLLYRQEWVKCGRPACKSCSKGQGHGPYWYAYFTKDGKKRKKYIGKERPN
jgi:hypothetical protein